MGDMENFEEVRLLAEWRAAEVRMLPVSQIKTEAGLQVRNERAAAYGNRRHVEATSREQITRLRAALEDDPAHELAPVLVAEVERKRIVVVDGHHRLRAYQQARRPAIPCQLRKATMREAARAARAANFDDVKLPLDRDQARECVWQAIGEMTQRGTCAAPHSRRDIQRVFPGVSRGGIDTMIHRAPKVPWWRHELEPDPITGWPSWKSVKVAVRADNETGTQQASPDEQRRRKVQRLAEAMIEGAMGADDDDPSAIMAEAYREACGMLADDADGAGDEAA